MALAALLVLPMACDETTTIPGGWTLHSITPDGSDTYAGSGTASSLEITAPAGNTGRNLRVAAIHDSTPVSIDQQSCVTWKGPSVRWVQPGVVLRASNASGRLRGIMVSNNIAYGTREVVNVHLFDTSKDKPLTQLPNSLVSPHIGDLGGRHPLPWRFCARVEGRKLDVKVWALSGSEPSWGDSSATATFTLPTDWVKPGRPGIYLGHLTAGDEVQLSEADTARVKGGAQDRRWDDLVEWASTVDATITRSTPSGAGTDRAVEQAAESVGHGKTDAALAGLVHGARGRAEEIRWVSEKFIHRPAKIHFDTSRETVDFLATSKTFSEGLTDRQFVERLYERILERSPTKGQADSWVSRLSSGTSRVSVARSIWRSTEHRRNVATDEYSAVFGHAPGSAERDRLADLWTSVDHEVTALRAHLAELADPAPSI